MPFLDWFKRKPETTESETAALRAEKPAPDLTTPPELIVRNLPPDAAQGSPPTEQILADLPPKERPSTVGPLTARSETIAARPISVPIEAFYAKLPAYLLTSEKPDLTRCVQIAEEDVVVDQETQEATLPLSILSLSCPEIFLRAVDASDDVPINFSLRQSEELEQPIAENASGRKGPEAPLPPAIASSTGGAESSEPSEGAKKEISLRLQPIFSNFPPELEPPSIHALMGTQAEIALPLGLIQAQLPHGRVVVPAEIFCGALPSDLKPYFEGIDPAAEIPIPLQEVFSRLPSEAVRLREDQEMDRPEETIPTPFTAHAEEDAKRLGENAAGGTAPVTEAPQPKVAKFEIEGPSERLQAIFMTDDPLDLAKTIKKIAELPGLQSCMLSTTNGIKIAGSFGDPSREKAVSALLPEFFQRTRLQFEELHAGTLETISFYFDIHQVSTFVQGELCLTVLHENRPFKPGVREKIQTVISELAALGVSEKPV